MSVRRLKNDAIDAAQKHKARYKQTLDPNDLDLFQRLMDVYNHLEDISSLSDLSDVDVSTLFDGGVLVYNSTSGKWESKPSVPTFVFIQSSSQSTWTIAHNLDKFPSVTVVDSANNVVIGDVLYNSLNELTILFCAAFSGKAFLN